MMQRRQAGTVNQQVNTISYGIQHLKLHHIDTDDNIALLKEKPKYAIGIARVLSSLNTLNIDTPVNKRFLITHAEYAANIKLAIDQLRKVNIANDENIKSLFLTAQHAGLINYAFRHCMPEGIPPQKAFDLYIYQGEDIQSFAQAYCIMCKLGIATDENIQYLQLHKDKGRFIFRILKETVSINLNRDDFFKSLIQNANCAKIICKAFDVFNSSTIAGAADVSLFTARNISFLLEHAAFSIDLAACLIYLGRSGIATEDTYILLAKKKSHTYQLRLAIESLFERRLLTENNFNLLAKYPDQSVKIAQVLGELKCHLNIEENQQFINDLEKADKLGQITIVANNIASFFGQPSAISDVLITTATNNDRNPNVRS